MKNRRKSSRETRSRMNERLGMGYTESVRKYEKV